MTKTGSAEFLRRLAGKSEVMEAGAVDDTETTTESAGRDGVAMRSEDYVELLEWTGRCVVEGRVKGRVKSFAPRDSRVKGCAPRDLIEGGGRKPLEGMELEVENWVETVERYGSIYHRVAGKVENLKHQALELGQRWVSGQGKSRWVFRRKGCRHEVSTANHSNRREYLEEGMDLKRGKKETDSERQKMSQP